MFISFYDFPTVPQVSSSSILLRVILPPLLKAKTLPLLSVSPAGFRISYLAYVSMPLPLRVDEVCRQIQQFPIGQEQNWTEADCCWWWWCWLHSLQMSVIPPTMTVARSAPLCSHRNVAQAPCALKGRANPLRDVAVTYEEATVHKCHIRTTVRRHCR